MIYIGIRHYFPEINSLEKFSIKYKTLGFARFLLGRLNVRNMVTRFYSKIKKAFKEGRSRLIVIKFLCQSLRFWQGVSAYGKSRSLLPVFALNTIERN